MLGSLPLYVHSLRHLRPVQVWWRGYLALSRLRGVVTRLPASLILRAPPLVRPVTKHAAWEGDTFRFLNRSVRFDGAIEWNRPGLDKLWLYNLHYFDWVNQAGVDSAAAVARMGEWVAGNPPASGNGWEPYPLSLRLVNWVKFLSSRQGMGEGIPSELTASLYLQARHLDRHLEYHLLGNHLFKNAVALLFAGACFDGGEARSWHRRGRRILLGQLDEQILPDGGHFERSVMYHAITLEDVLDCVNLLRAAGRTDDELLARLDTAAWAMLQFLADVLHPDGEIPLFNDSAVGIAPRPSELFAYAERLGLDFKPRSAVPMVAKPDFGLYVFRRGDATLLFDVGAIGPDYLPGHAHCDTLSFELSLGADRWIVNAGTFAYTGPDRARYRGTAAHNTLMIDGAEQHEIWASFRVARRGYPVDVEVRRENGISAAHTGYRRLPGEPLHRREIRFEDRSIVISDEVEGQRTHRVSSVLHLHPDVVPESVGDCEVVCHRAGRTLRIESEGLPIRIEPYDYAPEFGLKITARRLLMETAGPLPLQLGVRLRPS